MIDSLQKQYKDTTLQLIRCMLLDDEDDEPDEDSSSDSRSKTPKLSSQISSPSPLSSPQGTSPFSDSFTGLIHDSSLDPPSNDHEADLFKIILDKFQHLQDEILTTCYLQPTIGISCNSQLDLLWWYKQNSGVHFWRKVRVSADAFDHLVSLVQDDPIFTNNSFKSQLLLLIQHAIFLNWLSHYGNVLSVDDIAEWAGVSPSTVINTTKRCMLVIVKLHDRAFSLPTESKKTNSKAWSQQAVIPEWWDGWLAIGGTTVPLFQKPGLHKEAWFDKSSWYSMNGQFVMLLHNLCFVDYLLGRTGITHDSYTFQSTRISSDQQAFFAEGEWMWVDSAYPIRPWCITPFRKWPGGNLSWEEKHFNYHLSTVQVRAEHAISLLKGRFQSLCELHIQIGTSKLHLWVIFWVHCCIILHNLIIQFEDESNSPDTKWNDQCAFVGLTSVDDSAEPDRAFYCDVENEDGDPDIAVSKDDDASLPPIMHVMESVKKNTYHGVEFVKLQANWAQEGLWVVTLLIYL